MKIKNYRKRKKGTFITLLIVLSFIIAPILLFGDFGHATIQEEDVIPDLGYLVNVGKRYWYQGTFYDDADFEFAWTTSEIQFIHIETSNSYEHDITDFLNYESHTPYDETNFTVNDGSYSDLYNLQDNDNNYGSWNYTGIGEYRASYSFIDELTGTSGDDIDFVDYDNSGTSASVEITSNWNEHKKVLNLTADAGGDDVDIRNDFSSGQESGTYEFWVYNPDVTRAWVLTSYDGDPSGMSEGVQLMGDSDDLWYYDVGYVKIEDLVDNTWYHIQVDFECGTGLYKGLAADTFYVYLDGIQYGPYIFRDPCETLDNLRFIMADDLDYSVYWDAFGYSWDNDYMVGWNREEYAFFGDYNSTYSFENQDIGDEGTTIDLIDTYIEDVGFSDITIDGGIGGHKKVLQLHQISGGSMPSYFQDEFPQVETDMTIEFWIWMYGTDNWGNNLMFYFMEGLSNIIRIYFDYTAEGYIRNDDAVEIASATESLQERWQHIKIVCDDTVNTFDFYLDDVDMGTFNYKANSVVGIDEMRMYIDFHVTGSSDYYIDAIDYSWSAGYSLGRNRLTENHDLLQHYPASHSFPFDDVGLAPEGWDSAAYTIIDSAWQEHRKVLKLTRDGTNPIIEHDFYDDITSGTIEFYFGSDDVTQLSHLRLYDGASSVIQINLYDNKIQYRYDGAYNSICDAIDNNWYHIKLDFETGAGEYQGLAADTFYITIDGTQYGPYSFNNVAPHIDKIYFTCNSGAVYNFYVDAIDYSWDPNYYTGRNVNPTRVNLLGQYPASYSFESELVYAEGTEISFIDSINAGTTANIISSLDGNRKVLNYTETIDYQYTYNYFNSEQISGTIEFWSQIHQTNLRCMIYIYDNSDGILLAFYEDGKIKYNYGSWVDTGLAYVADTWYHFKIEFDCTTDWHLWINGISMDGGAGYIYYGIPTAIDRFYIRNKADTTQYWDAFSYSWDDNYLIGDNLHFNNFLGSETFENYDQTYLGNYYGTESFNYYTESEVYYGTYDFRDDADASYGNGQEAQVVSNVDYADYCIIGTDDGTVEILASEDGHKKVLNLTNTGASAIHVRNDFSIKTSGIVEFWMKGEYGRFYIADSVGAMVQIICREGTNLIYFNHGDGIGGTTSTTVAWDHLWTHIKIEFDTITDTFSGWKDEVKIVDNVNFAGDTDSNGLIYTYCALESNNIEGYYDAIGYSWDTTSHSGLGYTIDYNKLSQDIEPILEGGYEIDNIYLGDLLETVNILDGHMNIVNITGSSDTNSTITGSLISPDQWDDFTFTEGAGDTVGELETDNDADYSIVNSGSFWGAEYLLGYIVPADSDILTNWDEGDAPPHWSLLDEAKGDMNGDGGNIRDREDDVHDRWNFDSLAIPAGGYVSKIVVFLYVKDQSDLITQTLDYTTSETATVNYDDLTTSYVWRSTTHSGLNIDQAGLDAFWVDVNCVYVSGTGGFIDIETVYVDIYVTPIVYEHDWYMTWNVINPISIDYFRYDYMTTVAIDCDLDIYNWDTTLWLELQSNTDVNWHTSFYILTDPYIDDGTNRVRVRFQTATHSASFDIEMDQITLDYTGFLFSFDTRSLSIYDTFSQGSGTIEFWSYFMDCPYANRIIFNNDTQIYHNGSYYWRYDTTNTKIDDLGISQWVHFKIEWIGNDVDVYMNGTKFLDTFWSDGATTLTRIDFMSFVNCSLYVDAVGFSWDSDYDVGDNINSHGKAVITALENEGWTIIDVPYTSVGISGEFNSHKKILNITADVEGNNIDIYNSFGTPQVSGTYEFYIKMEIASDNIYLYGMDGTTTAIQLRIYTDHLQAWYTAAWNDIGVIFDNQWYHIRVDFECGAGLYEGLAADTYNVYLNGTRAGPIGIAFSSARTSLTQIRFYYTQAADRSVYVNSIGYSWKSNYDISDNLHCNIETIIDFIVDIPFDFTTDILQINVSSLHFTSDYMNINWYIYNFESSLWELINNSAVISETLFEFDDITSPSDYFSESNLIRFRYYGFNCSSMYFLIDELEVNVYFKTEMEYQKILNLIGVWKYRFVLDEGLLNEFNSTWIFINVVQFASNVELISESPYYTEWEFLYTSETTSTITIYDEDFTGDDWDIDVSDEVIVFNSTVSDDSYVDDSFPNQNQNYGSSDVLYVEDSVDVRETYIKKEFLDLQNYLLLNVVQNSTLRIYETDAVIQFTDVNVYTTSDFDEGIITWNNKPAAIDYISTLSSEEDVWNIFDLGDGLDFYFVLLGGEIPVTSNVWYESKESEYVPTIAHYISKFYQDTSNGYVYIQTDESETLKLNSPSIDLDLFVGAKIKLIFNTTSTNKIDLNLLNSGEEQKTFEIVPQGNTNFDDQVIVLSVDGSYSVDQLQFEGIFDDTENLIVKNITIYQYNSTAEGDTVIENIDPDGIKQVFLEFPYNYTCNIYEQDLLVDTINFTSSYDKQTFIYEVPRLRECYISFFDSNDEYLNFNLFTTYINYTYDEDSIINERLSSNIISIDDDTLITFKIYDSFDILVKSYQTYEEMFIDITLPVYELKIRNEAIEYVEYDLSKTGSDIIKSGNIFSDEIIEFSIASGNYSLDYINYEDSYPRQYNFTLSDNRLITINTTYHIVYFGLFTYDGLGLNRDWVRFYINGIRKDFGRNIIESETAVLIVLDYFNNTLANETIDASAWSEWNIYVQVYSMYILNQFTYDDLIMNITQVGSGYNMSQLIPCSSALLYRFIPDVNYTITATYVNDTIYNVRTINLTDNSQIESFGVPSKPEEYPKNVFFGVYTSTGLGIDHDLLRFYIDGNRADFGFNRITDEIINITVMDYFNTTLFTNPTFNTSGIYEYNILITLYSLKIKNEARIATNYTLSYGALETTGFILPNEITEYQLSSNNYVFDYTNNEDGTSDTININLNQDRVYILNSTYYTTYFSLYSQNGVRLDDSLFSLYLNGTRKDFGFVELATTDILIVVYDYLNFTAFNNVITLSGSTEYNIIITVFELQIRHLAQVNSNITLFETTNHNHVDFLMSPNSLNSFMLSSSTYNVTWINGENGISTVYDINLYTNYILTLNTSYYDIFFSLFDVNLHIIDPYQYVFRLNTTIQDFGFVMDLQTDDYTITVDDRFGTSLFNSVVELRDLNEYRIDITLYELQIRHLGEENSNLSLYETTAHGSLNFSMAPNSITSLILASSTYNITWTNGENGVATVYDITLNSDYILTLNTSYYDIYFSLYDQNSVRLEDSLFSLYVNATRKDFGFVVLETDDNLILVQDYLNVTVFNQVVALRNFDEYNIIITVFELQIRHLAYENSNITLYETTSHNCLNFSMAPDTINKFMLANSTYNITWVNGENSVSTFYNITLNENYILTLESSYFEVYFGLYTYDGLGVSRDWVRFYVNGDRKDFNEVLLTQDTNTLLVMDYFNQTLYSANMDLRPYADGEWNIYIEIFTLILQNYYKHNIIVEIENNDIAMNFLIPVNTSFSYRFVPNVHYRITWFYINGTKINSTRFELEENPQKISFGFFEMEVPYDPEPLMFDTMTLIAFVIVVCIFGWIIVILYARWKGRALNVPEKTRKLYKNKNKGWKAGTFKDEGI